MELSLSWGTATCAATQEFRNILLDMNLKYRVHRSSPAVAILSQIIPVHTTSTYLPKIHLLLILKLEAKATVYMYRLCCSDQWKPQIWRFWTCTHDSHHERWFDPTDEGWQWYWDMSVAKLLLLYSLAQVNGRTSFSTTGSQDKWGY
jgi:hypothetical protein